MTKSDINWIVGSIVSALVGIIVGIQYTFPAGVAVAWILFLLVDIRQNTDKSTD